MYTRKIINSPTLTFNHNNTLDLELNFWSIYKLIFTCIFSPCLTSKLSYLPLKRFRTISSNIPFISPTHFKHTPLFCFTCASLLSAYSTIVFWLATATLASLELAYTTPNPPSNPTVHPKIAPNPHIYKVISKT